MKSLSRQTLAQVTALCCAICFIVSNSAAQTVSAKSSARRAVRERVATIFRETLKQGEFSVERGGGRRVTARTFVPPSTEHVDEMRRYGDDAIPVLAEYLNSGSGFEKYLAMRLLGAIGGKGVVEPLGKIALSDASAGFRLAALLWLTDAPWDLASPIIRQAAEHDDSSEVRDKALEILARHESR